MDYMDQNEELYRAWIGDRNQDDYYRKMKNGGFNWWAFFFRELYLLSRKMFIESVILTVGSYILFMILGMINVPDIGYNILAFVIALTTGFLYYPLYKWNIKRKIEKYKKKGLSYEEQLEIAKKYGGDKATVAVIVMVFIEFIIVSELTLAPRMIANILNSEKTDTFENSKSMNNTKNSDSYFNDSYDYEDSSSNYYSNESNHLNQKWNLDSFALDYDSSDWQEGTYQGKRVLKYKNKENYLVYTGTETEVNKAKKVKSEENREQIEKEVESQLEKTEGISVLYSNWEELNDDVYVYKIECNVTVANICGYLYYYYYIIGDNLYGFMLSEVETDLSFQYDAEDVMNTIQNNI